MTAPTSDPVGGAGPRATARRRAVALDALSLLVVLAGVVAVPLVARDVAIGSDPVRYVLRATTWPDIRLGHQQLRWGLMIPLRVLTDVLGPTQFLFHAVATGLTAIWATGTWLLGRVLAGRTVGTVAALLLVLNPLSMRSGTYRLTGQIMPDLPAAGLITLGLAVLLLAVRTVPSRRRDLLLVSAGVSLGLAYAFREYAPLFYAVVPVVLWRAGRGLRDLVLVAVPPLLILVAELTMYGVLYGEPLVRFTVAGGHGRVRDDDPIAATEALGKLPEALFLGPHDLTAALLLAAILATVAAAVVRRRDDLVVLASWIVVVWVLLTLAAGLVRPTQPLLPGANIRYWSALLPPAAVGVAIVARDAWQRAGAARILAVLIAAALVATMAAGLDHRLQRPTSDEEWNQLRVWLRSNGDDVAVLEVDAWAAETLELYRRDATSGRVRWEGEMVVRERDEAPDLDALAARGPGSYTVVTRWQISPYPDIDRDRAPMVFRSETGWIRVFEVEPASG